MDEGEETPPAGGAGWAEAPGLAARGACMGMADVIPGVSGGTMALILGIYARLVEAIKSFDLAALKSVFRGRFREGLDRTHWRFMGPVVCGQALGIVLFTKVLRVPHLLDTYPEQVYAVFFGLVLGSIGLLLRDTQRGGPFGKREVLAALGGLALGLLVTQAGRGATPQEPWFVFFAGSIAISAMILPGISGSFILLILRQYGHVLNGLDRFLSIAKDPAGGIEAFQRIVLPFALGCFCGIVLFSRLLSYVLRVAKRETMAAMIGLLVGSLLVIWPFQVRIYETVRDKARYVGSDGLLAPRADAGSAVALALILVGVLMVLGLDRLARGRAQPQTGSRVGPGELD